ncbi:putative transforming protein E6 [Bos taurus papillomavirus 5]|uniref:Protein E6 n=1 Tax=Bovine papillomavirus type 5 TaxID=2491661 RepID=VE6_BPV5|nr:putative transforming protein E6 [Epsilonpapillomavirus 1]Q8BDG7.1 RecName: Full=Protein E6 [Bos taurus papillomavirus 5]AAN09924.1 putative transforming protein E6 [Bos taurus papillomavirus 5]CAF05671.1 E6 protein [Epsilonpapillomavirus 1]
MPYWLPTYNFEGLQCLQCKKALGSLDALKCKNHKYRRVHRGGKPYGMCQICLEALLQLERQEFPWTLLLPKDFVKVLGRLPGDYCVRCYYCGCVLSDSEKDRHALDHEGYLYVRGRARGRCYSCSSDGRRPCVF